MGNWINVNEKLPENDGEYLIAEICEGNSEPTVMFDICRFAAEIPDDSISELAGLENVFWKYDSEWGDVPCSPSFWMPIPDLPEVTAGV